MVMSKRGKTAEIEKNMNGVNRVRVNKKGFDNRITKNLGTGNARKSKKGTTRTGGGF